MAKAKSKVSGNTILLAILGAAGAYAVYKSFQGGNLAQYINLKLTSIRILNAGEVLASVFTNPKPAQIELVYDVTNTGAFDFRFTGFRANIIYNGANMGEVVSNETKQIPARSSGEIKIKSTIDSSKVLTELVNVLLVDGQLHPVRILGSMQFNGVNVPVDQTKELIVK